MNYYRGLYNELYTRGYNGNRLFSHGIGLSTWARSCLKFNSVCDVGCSWGHVLRYLSDCAHCTGIDVADHTVDYINTRNRTERRSLTAVQGCITKMPFETDQFELTLCTDVIEHIRPVDLKPAVSELHRVTSKYLAIKAATYPHEMNGIQLHPSVKTTWEWIVLFLSYGGTLIYLEDEHFVIDLQTKKGAFKLPGNVVV